MWPQFAYLHWSFLLSQNIFLNLISVTLLLQPSLVGKAVLPLKRLLTAKSPNSSHYHLEVKSSSLAEAVRERETDDAVVGTLEVHLTLLLP